MIEGITVSTQSLIALRQHARKPYEKPVKTTHAAGRYLSHHRGRGMDFNEARHYQAGDEIRHMEWRMTARTGKPHTKVYQEERERPVVILNDFNPSMYFGTCVAFKSVLAARLAALIGWTAVKQGDKVGGLLANSLRHQEFMPQAREKGLLAWLAALSGFTQAFGHTSEKMLRLSSLLLRVRRVARPGSIVVIISDFYSLDADSEKHLHRLRAHNELLFYHICDALELGSPKIAGTYPIANHQESILLNTQDHHMAEAYQQFCQKRLGAVKSLCQRLQSQYTLVSSHTDLPCIVRSSFPRRSHV